MYKYLTKIIKCKPLIKGVAFIFVVLIISNITLAIAKKKIVKVINHHSPQEVSVGNIFFFASQRYHN